MYQVQEVIAIEVVAKSKRLQAELMKSPFWLLLKDEPVVKEFLASVESLEKEIAYESLNQTKQ